MLTVTVDLSGIQGGAEAFRTMPARLSKFLLRAMLDSMHRAIAEMKARVPVRTGNLRRSGNEELPPQLADDGIGYVGRLGFGAAYAAAVEFGKTKPESVRSFQRTNSHGTQFTVRAFTRTPNMSARPYIRPGLEAATPYIRQYHIEAVEEAVKE